MAVDIILGIPTGQPCVHHRHRRSHVLLSFVKPTRWVRPGCGCILPIFRPASFYAAPMASMGRPSERSKAALTKDHLKRLGKLARQDREGLFARNPHLAVYRDRILLVALCQGAALHYLDGINGVKDLDVYTFYAVDPDVAWPYRRHGVVDFGPSELGWRPADEHVRGKRFVGRAVDLFGRALRVAPEADPVNAVRDWLQTNNSTPRLLRRKAVVGIEPSRYLGKTIWLSRAIGPA